MYVVKVLSHLGGWEKLLNEHPEIKKEIFSAARNIFINNSNIQQRTDQRPGKFTYSVQEIKRSLDQSFKQYGWKTNIRILVTYSTSGPSHRYSETDAIKDGVGLEYIFGKFAFSESDIFVKFPLFIQKGYYHLAVLLVPVQDLNNFLPIGIGNFEFLQDRFSALITPFIKYPLVILGIYDYQRNLEITELTSELDRYFIDELGLTLFEMKMQTEQENYDFKQSLPANDQVAKGICAFANNVDGGFFLVGVDDEGQIVGFPRDQLDEKQIAVNQVSESKCSPTPEVENKIFDVPDHPDLCVWVIRVKPVENKPCMTSDKVFIRAGSSSRPANSIEIRRLVLRSSQ